MPSPISQQLHDANETFKKWMNSVQKPQKALTVSGWKNWMEGNRTNLAKQLAVLEYTLLYTPLEKMKP